MKCEYTIIHDNSVITTLVIENKRAYIKDDDAEEILNVDSKECFNTLISLFSLKDNWEKEECLQPIHQIKFENNQEIEVYKFGSDVPNNYSLFLGCLSKIVGESL